MSVNSNTKIQFKRSTVAGLAPNTVSSSNGNYIYPGQIALNLTDKKAYSSNGSHAFELGSNLTSLSVYGNTILRENTTLSKLIANNVLGSSQILASNSTGGIYWKTETEVTSGDLVLTDFSDPATINAFLRDNQGKTIYLLPSPTGYYTLNTLTNTPTAGEVVEIPPNTNLVGIGIVEIRPNNPTRGAFAFMHGADNTQLHNLKIEFDYGCERISVDFKRNDSIVIDNYRDDYWWSRDPNTLNALYANGTPLGLSDDITNAAPGRYKLWVDAWNAAHPSLGQITVPTAGNSSKIKDRWAAAGYTTVSEYDSSEATWNRNCGVLIHNSNHIKFYNVTANNCLVQFNIQGGVSTVGTSTSTDLYFNKIEMGDDVEFGLLGKKVENVVIDQIICNTVGINRNHAEPHVAYFSNEPTLGNKSKNILIKSAICNYYQPGTTLKTKQVENFVVESYVGKHISGALSLGAATGYVGSLTVEDQVMGRIITESMAPTIVTFDGSNSTLVSTSTDIITLDTNPYTNGDIIAYTSGTSGSAIGGLIDGRSYYVINTTPTSIKLTTVQGNPANVVNITSVGSGSSHRLVKTLDSFSASDTNEYDIRLTGKYKVGPEYLINMNDSEGFNFGPIRVTQRAAKSRYWYGEEDDIDDSIRLFDAEGCNNIHVACFDLESARLTDGSPQIRLRRVRNSTFGEGSYLDFGRNHNREDTELTITGNSTFVNTSTYAITSSDNDLNDGDVVIYTLSTGSTVPLTSLVDEGMYYVRESTGSTFKLSLTPSSSILPISSIPVGATGDHLFTRSKAQVKLYEISTSSNLGGSSDNNKFNPVRLYNSEWGMISTGSSFNTIELDRSIMSNGYVDGVTIVDSECLGDGNYYHLLDGDRVVDVDVSALTDNTDKLQTSGKSNLYIKNYYELESDGEFSTEATDFKFSNNDTMTIGSMTYKYVDALNFTDPDNQILLMDNLTYVNRATTAAITTSGIVNVDGTNVANTDRILVKDQANAWFNGIYNGNTAGPWSRSEDANTWDELKERLVYVESGSTNANTYYMGPSGDATIDQANVVWTLTTDRPSRLNGERLLTRTSDAINATLDSGLGNGGIYIISGIHPEVQSVAKGNEMFVVANEKGALVTPIETTLNLANISFVYTDLAVDIAGDGSFTYTDTYVGDQIAYWTYPILSKDGLLDMNNVGSIRRYDTTDSSIEVILPEITESIAGIPHKLQKLSNYNSLVVKNSSGSILKRMYDDQDYVECIVSNDNRWIINFNPKNSLPTVDVSIPWNASLIDLAGSKTEAVIQGIDLRDLVFSANGHKVYTINDNQNRIRQYTLSTPWDISTATYGTDAEDSYVVSSLDTTPNGLAINDSGNTFYFVGDSNNKVYELKAATNYVVNSSFISVPSGGSFDISTEVTVPHAVAFSNTGSKMYIFGKTPSEIFEYQLSTPWQVNTSSYVTGSSFSLESEENQALGLHFKPDGTKMYVVGNRDLTVDEYTLGTAWQVNTASYSSSANSTFGSDRIPHGVYIKTDGSTLYAATANSTHSVLQSYAFSLPSNTYNVSAKHSGKTLVVSSTSGINVAATAINADEIGTKVDIIRAGTGTITVVGDGVTVYKSVASANLRAQYSLATITYNATNSIIVSGDLG